MAYSLACLEWNLGHLYLHKILCVHMCRSLNKEFQRNCKFSGTQLCRQNDSELLNPAIYMYMYMHACSCAIHVFTCTMYVAAPCADDSDPKSRCTGT